MDGVERIAVERKRQVEKQGWTAQHDDDHEYAELAWAAVCYAAPDLVFRKDDRANQIIYRDPWQFDPPYDKREYDGNIVLANWKLDTSKRIRQLEMAGALIAAEINKFAVGAQKGDTELG